MRIFVPSHREVPHIQPGWNQTKTSKKLRMAVSQKINTVNSYNSTTFSFDNLDSFDIVPIEFDNDVTALPLTNDFYQIESLTDCALTNEFPILHASVTPASAKYIKQEQTDAQKEATKQLRMKFRYPSVDPEPNFYKDTRTELQKMESILRTTSQILDKDQLEIWNSITERNLHLSAAHNSGIPLLKSDITEQIKNYRLDNEHKKALLDKVNAFDHLYVQEKLPAPRETAQTQSEQSTPLQDEEPLIPDIITETMTSSSLTMPAPLSTTVLSTKLRQLWLDDRESNVTVITSLKNDSHLCFSAIHCLIPVLLNPKIFNRILKKWNKFKPKRRFRIKIARLLVKHNIISNDLLRRKAKVIKVNFQTGG